MNIQTDIILAFLREWRHYNGFDSKEPNANVVSMHPLTWEALRTSQRRCEPGWDLVDLIEHRPDGELANGFVWYRGKPAIDVVAAVFDPTMAQGEFAFDFVIFHLPYTG